VDPGGESGAQHPYLCFVRIQGVKAVRNTLICKKIFEIDSEIFKLEKSLKLTVNFNMKCLVPPLSPDPGSTPDLGPQGSDIATSSACSFIPLSSLTSESCI
jgi:hypothetical protein